MGASSRVDVGFRSERGPILVALMLATALVALESTILATAVPTIVADLGGFTQFPWLFSSYLLTQAVLVPVYGKLSDLYGRKPMLLFGIGVFAFGSVLCALAWSMPALIAFRALQGLGAGAVLPMAQTIAGDIYTVAERAKAQGYLASVWGMSAIVGPAVGGLFADFLSWRWIFWVNVPLCALAAWVLLRSFHENNRGGAARPVDWAGAATLAAGAALLILGLLEGGQSWGWTSAPSLGIFAAGFAFLALFAWIETRAPEPILPLWVLTRRVLVTTSIVSCLVGAVVLGLTSYVPSFVQGSLGTTAVVAGFTLATMTIGWPIAAAQSGRLYLRIGFRNTGLVGAVPLVTGAILLTRVGSGSSAWHVAGCCVLIGLGMGLIASPALIAAQSSVGWAERGVVTGANAFARALGSAVGVAVFGALANASLARSGVADDAVVPDPQQLADSISAVFGAVLVAALALVVAVSVIPRRFASGAAGSAADAEAD
ncbi:MDR family MFS transporter [Rhodococcus chondri]|uniref:MDR family MFS transporter n=1 Tax=Rhodococcus chondri TaxID=3065941 RepID=A0ABU7JYR8_9NOCA|nr:MDR family MFS transporter [Rhodococcus sp. CC-R104]MEE2035160.1 MDR family MFS transporter [Rhodococcus sp. CC-R104]